MRGRQLVVAVLLEGGEERWEARVGWWRLLPGWRLGCVYCEKGPRQRERWVGWGLGEVGVLSCVVASKAIWLFLERRENGLVKVEVARGAGPGKRARCDCEYGPLRGARRGAGESGVECVVNNAACAHLRPPNRCVKSRGSFGFEKAAKWRDG